LGRPPTLSPTERYHLETDASLRLWDTKSAPGTGKATYLAGGGIVLRDPNLRVIESHSVRLGYLSSAIIAEYAAIHFGLLRAISLKIRYLRVRNDNLSVIRALADPALDVNGEAAEIVERVRTASCHFESIEFLWAASTHSIQRSDGAFSADYLGRKACGLGLRPR